MMNRIAQRGPLLQKVLIGALVALFFAAALYLRVALPYDTVFGGASVKFTGVDAYYHVRIVENLVHNFPHLNEVDPYMLYPAGMRMYASTHHPFFDYLLAAVVWVVGMGSPSQHTLEVICAYFPAILGALTIIPVYFIGRTLIGRWAGVVAAGLIAISPGDFLGRSILGFTDHHIAETLFATTAVLFLLLSLKNTRREPLRLAHLRHPIRESTAKPLLCAVLAGVFLIIYLISWMGSLLFVFIFIVFLVLQFVADHLRGRPTDYLFLTGTGMFTVAFVIRFIVRHGDADVAALLVAWLVPVTLFGISRLMASRGLKPIYYPLGIAGLALVAFGLFAAVDFSLLKSMAQYFDIFTWQSGSNIMEMQPLLISGGDLSLSIVWQSYKFSLLAAAGALLLIGYRVVRRGEAGDMLVIVWTLLIVAAALAQRRFAYYMSVNIAVLAGYGCWEIVGLIGHRGEAPQENVKAGVVKKKGESASKRGAAKPVFRFEWRYLYATVAAIAIFSLLWFPTIGTAQHTASAARFAPSDEWCAALDWLRDNSPEPFDDPDFYYARYDSPFPYSDYPNAYGVMSWWDYGYWITRIGHRVPTLNPSGQPLLIPKVAQFLVSQDEASAVRISEEMGARYVLVDYLMAYANFDMNSGMLYGKFAPIVSYTDHQDSEYYDVFFKQNATTGQWEPHQFFFPAYYRTMAVRLYWFSGKAVEPPAYRVITYEERRDNDGNIAKVILSDTAYPTYQGALAASQTAGNSKACLVSDSPVTSAIPLDELQHYRLAPGSEAGGIQRPDVRIFQYVE